MAVYDQEDLDRFKESHLIEKIPPTAGLNCSLSFNVLGIAVGKAVDDEEKIIQLKETIEEIFPDTNIQVDWLNGLIHIVRLGV